MEKVTKFKNGIEKTYNVGFLKRLICKVCGDHCYPDMQTYFYDVSFDREIEELKRHVPEYEKLTVGTGNYLCHGCLTEIFVECPETITKIQRKY